MKGQMGAMSPVQCRMARAALRCSLEDVASHVGVSKMALSNYERIGNGIGHATAMRLTAWFASQRIYCGPGNSISINQRPIEQERFFVIAAMQLLADNGIYPSSGELLEAGERFLQKVERKCES